MLIWQERSIAIITRLARYATPPSATISHVNQTKSKVNVYTVGRYRYMNSRYKSERNAEEESKEESKWGKSVIINLEKIVGVKTFNTGPAIYTAVLILCDINFERNFYSIEMGHLQ